MQPSLDQVRSLFAAATGGENLCPVYREELADTMTPTSVFLALTGGDPDAEGFLLESVVGGEHLNRYSYVGAEPTHGLRADGSDPLTALEAELGRFKQLAVPGLPLPDFSGGAIGYVGYDAVRHFEPRVAPKIDAQRDVLGVPEAAFMFCDSMVVFDHVRNTVKVVGHVHLPSDGADGADDETLEQAYAAAAARVDALVDRLFSAQAPRPRPPAPPAEQVGAEAAAAAGAPAGGVSNVGQSGYEGFVRRLKEHIVAGDIIQAVPSQRVTLPMPAGAVPFDIYRQMRMVNPSPYLFYVSVAGVQIAGASPEMLVRVEPDGKVETHPIAGTRRRGATPAEDAALEEDLLADPKERAEHTMLVDLGRNDIGRVAVAGSVRVEQLMGIERYSHVMHIVSVVTGQLRPELSVYDAFRSVFPAGTVSGAPKVRAIELVAECEEERRHVYAGAVGYVSYEGKMDTAIAIRTVVHCRGQVYLQAGGGIVFDSEPTAEYEETVNKLAAAVSSVSRLC